MAGIGFELVFDIPGGIRLKQRKRIVPTKPDTVSQPDNVSKPNCASRFRNAQLEQDSACSDTTYKEIKRLRARRDTTYEEETVVEKFDWNPPWAEFELAIGFSQAGALVARTSEIEMRASVREAPSVTLYGNFGNDSASMYVGARTGLVSLVGGQAYTGSPRKTVTFQGSTFQMGPVLGGVVSIQGLHFFVEGAYMWRDIKSIEWDGDKDVGSGPRSADLSGASVALGVQFKFKDKK